MSAINFDGGFFLSIRVTWIHKRCHRSVQPIGMLIYVSMQSIRSPFGLLGFRLVDLVREPYIQYGFLLTLVWKLQM